MNLYKKAIDSEEISDFLLGRNDYFILNRDYGNHDITGTYMDILNFGIEFGEEKLYNQLNKDIEFIILNENISLHDYTNILGVIFFQLVYRKEEGKFHSEWILPNVLIQTLKNKFSQLKKTEDMERIIHNLKDRFNYTLFR